MKQTSIAALLFGALLTMFTSCSKSAEDLRPPTPIDTADKQAPTVPANLAGTVVATTSISLHWNPSTDNKAVTGYILYRGDSAVATLVGTAYVDSGLIPQTAYSYRVLAYDAAGNRSAKSIPVSITTEMTAPTIFVPTITTGEYSSATKTSIVFRGNVDFDGGAAIIARFFVITWTNPITGTAQKDSVVVSEGIFEYEKTDILPGLSYHCRAGALNSAGSGYGQTVSAATAGFHPGQDLGYGMVIYPYSNYDSAIAVSKTDLNVSIGYVWGISSVYVTGTSHALLAGRTNTSAIIVQDQGALAAIMSRAYTAGNKVWHLPSTEELLKIKELKNALPVAGSFFGGQQITPSGGVFPNGCYWASVQGAGQGIAYGFDFSNASMNPTTDTKTATFGVRVVTYVGL
ncbi:hypothetical protein IT401_02685 [Candidatus Nomurabacteria bacterium]|nr:hypothetical protein [Candidatus Nomurabacteria bacterium]